MTKSQLSAAIADPGEEAVDLGRGRIGRLVVDEVAGIFRDAGLHIFEILRHDVDPVAAQDGICRPQKTRAGCLIFGGLGAVPAITASRPAFCETYQLNPPCRLPGRRKLSTQRSSTGSNASLRYDQCVRK